MNGTAAKHKVATVKPILSGADSPPQVFQQAHIIATSENVMKNSMKNPCVTDTPGFIKVTQVPPAGAINISCGVSNMSKPYPMHAPIVCATTKIHPIYVTLKIERRKSENGICYAQFIHKITKSE